MSATELHRVTTDDSTLDVMRTRALETARAQDSGRLSARILGANWVLYPMSLILVLGAWYLAIAIFAIPPYLLPAPHAVAESGASHMTLLLDNSLTTLLEIAAAFALCCILGVPLGIAIASFRVVDKLVSPILVLSQGVPKIALAPVLLAWFGFGFKANLAIGFLIVVFPIVVNTVLGMRGIDPALLRLGKSLDASRTRLFWVVRLPAAMPSIFAGMKISVTFAAVGAIIGEFAAGSAGLGYLIQVTVGNLDMALGFAAIVATALVGWMTYLVVEAAEKWVLRGNTQQTQ